MCEGSLVAVRKDIQGIGIPTSEGPLEPKDYEGKHFESRDIEETPEGFTIEIKVGGKWVKACNIDFE